MKKIFIFTLMVIGYMSFTLSTNPPISSSATTSEFNSQVTSSVNSGAVNSAIYSTTASNSSFSVDVVNTSYVDPNNGKLYATGANYFGQLGLGYDEDGNRIGNQESFTPMFKSGDASQPFINPIDWSFSYHVTAVIDTDSKLWTTGGNYYGAVGNGEYAGNYSGWVESSQFTFELVAGLPEGYKAVTTRSGGLGTHLIVMLDDGTLWGAGNYAGLGLSTNGGVTSAGVEGGGYYPTFTQIDNTSEDDRVRDEMPFDTSEIVDFKAGHTQTLYLLEDGSLWRCNSQGYALVGEDVVSFSTYSPTYYVTSTGDVYFANGSTGAFNKILSAGEYEGTIISVEISANSGGWACLTTDGDVYFCVTSGGTDLFKIAEDVVYFDFGGSSSTNAVFGAITKSGEFKLWGSDNLGQLGNGSTEGSTETLTPENALDQFEEAAPSAPTTDGTLVTPPSVDPETGELQKDEDGNNVAIIPTLQTPAPAF